MLLLKANKHNQILREYINPLDEPAEDMTIGQTRRSAPTRSAFTDCPTRLSRLG